MKKFISDIRVAIVLLAIAVASVAVLLYASLRPVSYGMGYYNSEVYDGIEFKAIHTFGKGKEMTIRSTTFSEELTCYYYYRDGYVFSLGADTEEGYAEEVKTINDDFEAALNAPFYAVRINAFSFISEGPDGYTTVYTCYPAIMLVVVLGGVALIFAALGTLSLVLYRRARSRSADPVQ